VAKEVAGYNDVLRLKKMEQLWRRGITKLPRYPLPEPGFYSSLVTVASTGMLDVTDNRH
jgi:hypothetical protein